MRIISMLVILYLSLNAASFILAEAIPEVYGNGAYTRGITYKLGESDDAVTILNTTIDSSGAVSDVATQDFLLMDHITIGTIQQERQVGNSYFYSVLNKIGAAFNLSDGVMDLLRGILGVLMAFAIFELFRGGI